ncbi:MAG: TonB-dependent receptor [Bacteroidales bacterium]|jgi:TonB-linked SusC/RagA family outer membrane protein|nr:TonB-dependent receptor [Bacteroidales bacterium]
MKYIEVLLFIFFFSFTGYGQTKKVTGVVKDAVDGSTMPGVTVVKKGTLVGTATDVNGEFSLDVHASDTLTFSFIGKKTVEQASGQRNVLEVVLYDDQTQLDEVVITAFGKTKKMSMVSAIESVKMSDLKVPASNLTNALAGKIAGIISYQTTGEPGADNAQFFIRGVTTFGYKTSPLILIDGFESTTDDLARLQPDDIESFSVMKDASATVMYGARSANGIISIVTRGGFEGPARIDARFDTHVATPTQKIGFLDGVTYMRMYNEARITRNPQLGAFYDEQKILETMAGSNPIIYPNVDWYSSLFNKATLNEKFNMNVSGGGQVATYYVSGGYDHETGLLKVDRRNNFNNNIDINRFHIRSNVIFKLTPSTTLDTRLSGRFENYTGPYTSASDIYYDIMRSNPVDFPFVYEPDEARRHDEFILFGSSFLGSSIKTNPYASMVRGYEDRNETTITAMANLMQKLDFITPGLTINLKASANVWNKYSSRRKYDPCYFTLDSYNEITGEYKLLWMNELSGRPYLGNVEPGRDADGQYYYEAILNWSRDFGAHHPGATLVGMAQTNLITGGNNTSIYETLPEKNAGVSGRFTYNYDTRYFIDFSFGYNGSEKFTGNKRYGFFPAIGGGWLISNESFFDTAKKLISLLKLKATWGQGGNDAISNRSGRFFFLSDVSIGSGGSYRWGQDYMNSYGGYSVNRYANPNITWERSSKYNLGIELALFKDEAVKIQADYFGEVRSDIYWERENLPKSTGIESRISGNVGKVKSHGIDGSIDIQHSFSNSLWITGRGNFTYATNRIEENDERDYPDEYRKHKGYSVNQQWGLVAERLFVDEYEIANSPRQDFGTYQAGDIKYKDVNGDGVVDANDQVPMGYPTSPEIQYGFGLSLGYKRLDFSFFFQGNARVSTFLDPGVRTDATHRNEGIAPFVDRRNALPIIAKSYWSETNPDIYAFWPRLSTGPMPNNTQQSMWWLYNSGFLRLKTVELGYNLGEWQKIHLNNCRIYFSCENLFVISRFKLWDPEMGKAGLKYPPNKRFNVGIQLSF